MADFSPSTVTFQHLGGPHLYTRVERVAKRVKCVAGLQHNMHNDDHPEIEVKMNDYLVCVSKLLIGTKNGSPAKGLFA